MFSWLFCLLGDFGGEGDEPAAARCDLRIAKAHTGLVIAGILEIGIDVGVVETLVKFAWSSAYKSLRSLMDLMIERPPVLVQALRLTYPRRTFDVSRFL